jgi:hypothetical protein
MAGTIYEKSTRALLRDMLKDLDLKPGQVLTAQRALKWFADHYPSSEKVVGRAHARFKFRLSRPRRGVKQHRDWH